MSYAALELCRVCNIRDIEGQRATVRHLNVSITLIGNKWCARDVVDTLVNSYTVPRDVSDVWHETKH